MPSQADGRWLAIAAISLGALSACAGDTADSVPSGVGESAAPASEDELPVQTKLAELSVRGVAVRFLQTSPENVIVVAGSDTPDNPLGDPEIQGMSVVEMYEHFAHAPAPAALTAVSAASKATVSAGSIAGGAPQGGGQKHLPDEFRATYCTDWHMTCVPNAWLEDIDWAGRATWVNGLVEPVNGDGISLRVREERPVKGWHTIYYEPQINVGQHWRWHASAGGFYARRMQVYVENREENVSAGEAFCNGGGPFSAGYCWSDRFNWMFNSGVD
jgi:hypothetical protein